jgi:ABC-2 type transport system ATP-binding protein
LKNIANVRSLQPQGTGAYRIMSDDSSQTVTQLVAAALKVNVQVKALSVHNTTLDDVFVHYTGRQLRDQAVSAHAYTGWLAGTDR